MDPASETSAAVAFGRFLVLPHRRELLADGQPVKLGGRAFDVLIALIEARGAIVTKGALMARVWPGRTVEENALQSQISALRMALGGDRDLVRTVSGRGYQFIGEVRLAPEADNKGGADAVVTKHISAPTNLPEPLSELIGRGDEIREILHLAAAHRLVTLIGPGGIGKTRIALALARELLPHFVDGVWLAEFSALNDSGLVAATAAAALGLEPGDREIRYSAWRRCLPAGGCCWCWTPASTSSTLPRRWPRPCYGPARRSIFSLPAASPCKLNGTPYSSRRRAKRPPRRPC
jgi:DNA-binding winged helix-turn-helix (wHTH) protein